MIVRPPAGQEVPRHSNAPMNHVDIGPTSLGLCGLEAPESFQGTDWSHTLLPERPTPEETPDSAFLQHVYRKRFECLNRSWRAVRTVDGWKYVVLAHQPFALFNLNEDPYELNNLAFLDTHNEEREALQAKLADWLERTGDSFPLPEL
jgi:arylsulfatase A-like enzyme